MMLPISPDYRRPLLEAVVSQIVVALFCSLMLDGGNARQVCGMALVAFWIGAAMLVYRRPLNPTKTDLEIIRLGFLPLVVIAYLLVCWIWWLRGVL